MAGRPPRARRPEGCNYPDPAADQISPGPGAGSMIGRDPPNRGDESPLGRLRLRARRV